MSKENSNIANSSRCASIEILGRISFPGRCHSAVVQGFLSVLVLIALSACLPSTRIPVETVAYPYRENARQECLVVFLPGRGAGVRDYDKEGFIDMARRAGVRADMISIDLHIGYYREGTAFLRLRQDVIMPARDNGYTCIWLAGISLGAYGALEYETLYPGEITGLVLLAPYLGEKEIVNEIKAAGGVKTWEPGKVAETDYQRKLWQWIKKYAPRNPDLPVIYLGYGTEDRFALEDGLLAEALDPRRVVTRPGIHAWTTWKPLWKSLLSTEVNKGFLSRPRFQHP
jgi:pimeloyl-ACP methyl ester carboxylesterase